MARKILQRCAVGFSATILVQFIIVFAMAQADISVVTPSFSAYFANETAATIAQIMLCGLIGIAFSCGAMVFEIEKWSYLLQGAVHFALTAAVWMPIAYICWRPDSPKTALLAALGWLLTYAINWLVQYLIYRHSIFKLNQSIRSFDKEAQSDE